MISSVVTLTFVAMLTPRSVLFFVMLFSGHGVSLNPTLGGSLDQQVNTDEAVNLGQEGYEEAELGGYLPEGGEYTGEEEQEEYIGLADDAGLAEDQMEYSGEQEEVDQLYQDEVLDIQFNEPIDDEFQVSPPFFPQPSPTPSRLTP